MTKGSEDTHTKDKEELDEHGAKRKDPRHQDSAQRQQQKELGPIHSRDFQEGVWTEEAHVVNSAGKGSYSTLQSCYNFSHAIFKKYFFSPKSFEGFTCKLITL